MIRIYNKECPALIDKATLSDIKEGEVSYDESMETTHYSIVDQFVSATTTLNAGYGSILYA
jgi:gamma-glutamyltranspeptidase/glutathione hydrolase